MANEPQSDTVQQHYNSIYNSYCAAPRTGHMATGTRRLMMPCSFSRIFKKCLLNSKPSPCNSDEIIFFIDRSTFSFNEDKHYS